MTQRRVLWVVAIVLAVSLVVYAVMLLNRGETESSSQFPQGAGGIMFVDEPMTNQIPWPPP